METTNRRIARATPISQFAFVAFSVEDTAVTKFLVPASDTERDTGGIFLEDAQELDLRWSGDLHFNQTSQQVQTSPHFIPDSSQQVQTSQFIGQLSQTSGTSLQVQTSPILICATQQDSSSPTTPVVAEC